MNTFTFSGNLVEDATRETTGIGSTGFQRTRLAFKVINNSGWGENARKLAIVCHLHGRRAESAKLADTLRKGLKVMVTGEIVSALIAGTGKSRRPELTVDVRDFEFIAKEGDAVKGADE